MTLTTTLIIGAASIAVLASAAYLLPSSKRVQRTVNIKAAPADIYQLLKSNKGFQVFNPYKDKDPELKITLSGPDEGVGSSFAFAGKDGKGTQTITKLEENRSVTMLIDLGSMGQPEQTFELKPTDNGTQVTWGVTASFGMNPIGRIFGLFMEKLQGPTIERGLKNLSGSVEQVA